MKQNTLSNLILIAYLLMMIVSLVSAVDLFTLSHPSFAFGWIMSVAIEISIAALLIVNRKVPGIKSVLYVLGFITLFQICANTYSAYIHIENISPFAELFALDEWEVIDQKRMLAFATGGVLPAICLALIYIQNEVREQTETNKTNNKESDDKAYNIEDAEGDEDGGEAEDTSSPKSHIDQPISESESEEVPTPQQQDESAKDADINTEPEEQAEIATEQLSETDESNDQNEDTVESEATVEEPKKRKYTKKSTSKTAKKTSKKTKTSKSNKKPKASKASKKAEEQMSADEVSVTDVPESDPDSQSQESVAELAERLNDIRRGKHNPVSNGYSMML